MPEMNHVVSVGKVLLVSQCNTGLTVTPDPRQPIHTPAVLPIQASLSRKSSSIHQISG